MTKSFNKLRNQMSKAAQSKAKAKTDSMLAEMALSELREFRDIIQIDLAEALATKQANISRIERREDMYISTLKNYIHAIGGKLEITAVFPEGRIRINQFDD